MKNKDILNLYEGLYEISQNKDLKFNVKISFILAKNKNILQPLYDAIIETRRKILQKYGIGIENGDWKIPNENIPSFRKEWDEFMAIDNFICLQGISLEDIQNEKINVGLMEKLLPLIDK